MQDEEEEEEEETPRMMRANTFTAQGAERATARSSAHGAGSADGRGPPQKQGAGRNARSLAGASLLSRIVLRSPVSLAWSA